MRAVYRSHYGRDVRAHPCGDGCLHAAVPLYAACGTDARCASRCTRRRYVRAHGARGDSRVRLGRRPGLRASADVRLSRRIYPAGLGDGRIGAPRRADVPPRACRVFGGHGGGLCPWHLVFLLCIELHHRRTDRLLGGGLVLRRAAGSAGLPALRRGGVHRDSPLQGGALDS